MQRLAPLLSILTLASLTSTPAQAQWTTNHLSLARQGMASTSAGGKAFFAGGRISNAIQSRVDIYDESTGTWSNTNLTFQRTLSSATSLGNLAFFGGGGINSSASTALVEVYDAQAGAWQSSGVLSQARFALSAASVGTKVIFAGGATGTPASPVIVDTVDIYDSSLGVQSNTAAWSVAHLSHERAMMGVAVCGNKVIFAGGFDLVSTRSEVDIYDLSTNSWSTSTLPLSQAFYGASVGVGDQAYFFGGITGPGASAVVTDVVQIYDATNGTWTVDSLPAGPRSLAAVAAVGNMILVGGGTDGSGATFDVVEVFDTSTGTWLPATHLSQARLDLKAASVGTKALFAGGSPGAPAVSDVVDIYDGLVPTPFCFGDGSSGACPCGNFGTTGRGCQNSGATGGSQLGSSGLPLIANDTLVFSASGELPSVFTIFLQGNAHIAPVAFGDGLRCTGGALKRLYSHNAVGGVATAPIGSDAPISVRATQLGDTLGPGSVRYYQTYYRDPVLGFCPSGSSFNSSSALTVVWQ
ncbi:MAG: hypothetical protein IPJ19_02240 [Planctomycetes bacterium]|nr:hypothetical protein [Planctomycetota bacterium]